MCAELSVLDYGRVIPADNHYFVVLVTDTPAEASEEKPQRTLKKWLSLQSLSLTFWYEEKECQGYPILLPAHSDLRLKLTCINND